MARITKDDCSLEKITYMCTTIIQGLKYNAVVIREFMSPLGARETKPN